MSVISQSAALYRFLFLLVFSAALMIVDHRSALLQQVRAAVSVVSLPFEWAMHAPLAAYRWFDENYSNDDLPAQISALKTENQTLKARLQRYDALRSENERLTELLSLSRQSGDQALLAEIIEVGLDPYTHRLKLNRGMEAGIYVGQPAITPDGVLGQVSALGIKRSVVTLITDPAHALPVQIQRNGIRTVVRGLGISDRVEVPFLSAQADIRKGDILVTSGLGGGFPLGYKVARVREIAVDANEAFMRVDAATFANLDLTAEVLLLWGDKSNQTDGKVAGDG